MSEYNCLIRNSLHGILKHVMSSFYRSFRPFHSYIHVSSLMSGCIYAIKKHACKEVPLHLLDVSVVLPYIGTCKYRL